MAQRTGLTALAAMAAAIRSGFAGNDGVLLPIVASAAQMTRKDRCGLGFSLYAIGSSNSRGLVALLWLGPKTEEARSVPLGAGDQSRDLGEIAISLSVMSKSVGQHHDAVAPALPFPDQDRARLDPARQQDFSTWLCSICLHHLVEQALH